MGCGMSGIYFKASHPLGIGIYTSTSSWTLAMLSLEGEGWDEGEYNCLTLFSSPQPNPFQQERALDDFQFIVFIMQKSCVDTYAL